MAPHCAWLRRRSSTALPSVNGLLWSMSSWLSSFQYPEQKVEGGDDEPEQSGALYTEPPGRSTNARRPLLPSGLGLKTGFRRDLYDKVQLLDRACAAGFPQVSAAGAQIGARHVAGVAIGERCRQILQRNCADIRIA